MPFLEGKGWVRPASVSIYLTPAEVNWCYEAGNRIVTHRGYETATTPWRKGFVSNALQKGLVVELALCHYLNKNLSVAASPDTSLRETGDPGYDLIVNGVRIQVKLGNPEFESVLYRRVSDSGKVLGMNWSILVIGNIVNTTTVDLLGWCTSAELVTFGIIAKGKAQQAKHWNLEIPFVRLWSMRQLCVRLKLQCP